MTKEKIKLNRKAYCEKFALFIKEIDPWLDSTFVRASHGRLVSQVLIQPSDKTEIYSLLIFSFGKIKDCLYDKQKNNILSSCFEIFNSQYQLIPDQETDNFADKEKYIFVNSNEIAESQNKLLNANSKINILERELFICDRAYKLYKIFCLVLLILLVLGTILFFSL